MINTIAACIVNKDSLSLLSKATKGTQCSHTKGTVKKAL